VRLLTRPLKELSRAFPHLGQLCLHLLTRVQSLFKGSSLAFTLGEGHTNIDWNFGPPRGFAWAGTPSKISLAADDSTEEILDGFLWSRSETPVLHGAKDAHMPRFGLRFSFQGTRCARTTRVSLRQEVSFLPVFFLVLIRRLVTHRRVFQEAEGVLWRLQMLRQALRGHPEDESCRYAASHSEPFHTHAVHGFFRLPEKAVVFSDHLRLDYAPAPLASTTELEEYLDTCTPGHMLGLWTACRIFSGVLMGLSLLVRSGIMPRSLKSECPDEQRGRHTWCVRMDRKKQRPIVHLLPHRLYATELDDKAELPEIVLGLGRELRELKALLGLDGPDAKLWLRHALFDADPYAPADQEERATPTTPPPVSWSVRGEEEDGPPIKPEFFDAPGDFYLGQTTATSLYTTMWGWTRTAFQLMLFCEGCPAPGEYAAPVSARCGSARFKGQFADQIRIPCGNWAQTADGTHDIPAARETASRHFCGTARADGWAATHRFSLKNLTGARLRILLRILCSPPINARPASLQTTPAADARSFVTPGVTCLLAIPFPSGSDEGTGEALFGCDFACAHDLGSKHHGQAAALSQLFFVKVHFSHVTASARCTC